MLQILAGWNGYVLCFSHVYNCIIFSLVSLSYSFEIIILSKDIVDGPDPDLCDPCAGDMYSASGKGKGATMKCSKKKVKVQKSSKSSKSLSRRRMRID
jgi:hypothetical protein